MLAGANPGVEPLAVLGLRPETEADAPFLFALFESVKGPELAMVPEPMRRHLLEMQFRAMTSGYRATCPAARYHIITMGGAPAGRLIIDEAPDRLRVVLIALLPAWRARGIATAVMTRVLAEPRRRRLRCEATVSVDNLASRKLWAKLGFREHAHGPVDLIVAWP
jgi:RimJ/RimL family protein N-acetyltransferase